MLEAEHQKRRPAVLALSVFMACFVCSRRRPVGSVWARARDICFEHSDGLLMVVCNIYIGSYDMVRKDWNINRVTFFTASSVYFAECF